MQSDKFPVLLNVDIPKEILQEINNLTVPLEIHYKEPPETDTGDYSYSLVANVVESWYFSGQGEPVVSMSHKMKLLYIYPTL